MKYDMTVIINDPNTKEGMNSDLMFKLEADFAYTPDTYGNGYYMAVGSTKESDIPLYRSVYDIRYDKDFHKDQAISYLAKWADNYWSGKDGAYKLKSIKITRKENDNE